MNTSNPITASFVWSEAVALRSSELFYKYEFRHSYRRYVGWLFIAMAQFGVVGALKHDAYGMLVVSSFLLLYWYGIRWQMRKRLAKRLFKSSPLAEENIKTIFSEARLHSGEEEIAWHEVEKVVEKEDGFLFFMASKSTFFPREAFESAEMRDALRALIKKSGIVFEKEM